MVSGEDRRPCLRLSCRVVSAARRFDLENVCPSLAPKDRATNEGMVSAGLSGLQGKEVDWEGAESWRERHVLDVMGKPFLTSRRGGGDQDDRKLQVLTMIRGSW